MKKMRWIIVLGVAAWHIPQAHAAGSPESVAIVVNADSWASTAIANEYIQLRGIPASNVIYLSGIKSFDGTNVNEFREHILNPVLKTIESRGLSAQIDCVAYSADFPFGIDVMPDVGGKQLPQVITPVASINGLTYLYQQVLAKDTTYLDLNCNRYARRIIRPRFDSEWTPDERDRYEKVLKLMQDPAQARDAQEKERFKKDKDAKPKDEETRKKEAEEDRVEREKNLAEALKIHLEMKEKHPNSELLLYNLACCYGISGKGDEALAALREAVDCGWWDADHTQADDDLKVLRPRVDFKTLVQSMKSPMFDVYPAQGFRASQEWSAKGELAGAGEGRRYLLSVMLAYTSGRGNSVSEALNYLRRSATADGTHPNGTIYFPINGNVRSTTRQFAFRTTAQKLKELGVDAKLLDGVLPDGKADVVGAMIGTSDFNWNSSKSTILPGAIVEHLTSYGGMLEEGAGQTPFTEFLRYGAAGSSGTVTEPFALQAKFPFSFMHVHYAKGCTLAEAYYQSLTGPYQLLICGDPLCRPWAKIPKVRFESPKANETLKSNAVLGAAAEAEGKVAEYALFVDGIQRETIKTDVAKAEFKLDTTTLQNGWHEFSVITTLADPLMIQGRAAMWARVANESINATVSKPTEKELRWDKPLELEAGIPGAKTIEFIHNGVPVAHIEGEKGKASIDLRSLGQGLAHLQAVGYLDAGHTRSFQGEAVEFTVVPPPALAAVELAPNEKLANGFALSVADKAPQIIQKAEGDWLSKTGIKKDERFTVESCFRVAEDDVYQFQIHGGAATAIKVDGTIQDWPRGTEWWFVPVALKAGLHRLTIEGSGDDHLRLEIRFGGRGAQRMDGARFQHVER